MFKNALDRSCLLLNSKNYPVYFLFLFVQVKSNSYKWEYISWYIRKPTLDCNSLGIATQQSTSYAILGAMPWPLMYQLPLSVTIYARSRRRVFLSISNNKNGHYSGYYSHTIKHTWNAKSLTVSVMLLLSGGQLCI